MCHLILIMPLLALPVLWLLPLGEGVAAYAGVLGVSVVVYRLALKAMHAPLQNGPGTLLHATGTVRAVQGRRGAVWVASELWSADFGDAIPAVGDRVEVVRVEGVRLTVRKAPVAAATGINAFPTTERTLS